MPGLNTPLTVPYMDALGEVGNDPRIGDAVPLAKKLFSHGKEIGKLLSRSGDLLVLGECVPWRNNERPVCPPCL